VTVVVSGLALSLGSRAVVQKLDDSDSVIQALGSPEVKIPEIYQPSESRSLSEQNTSVTTVYFTPQDEETSTTVLFLYNTSDHDATVGLQTFQLDGSLYIDASIEVPAHHLVRICADRVNSFSSTWWNVAFINFKTFSTYAKMTLPAGVKVDGYVVWNGGSTYDPVVDVGPTLNLRFSSEPVSVPAPPVE